MRGYIYKITSPSGRIYIGQTININRRINRYKNLSCVKQPNLYNSFMKYGFDKHIIEIIEEIEYDKDVLDQLEIKYIKEFKCVEEGLNCRYGGNTSSHSKETRKKIGDGNRGKKLSEEHKIRISWKGKKHTEETKKKMSIKLIGNKRSLGKKLSEETKDKMKQATKKRARGLDGKFIKNILIV